MDLIFNFSKLIFFIFISSKIIRVDLNWPKILKLKFISTIGQVKLRSKRIWANVYLKKLNLGQSRIHKWKFIQVKINDNPNENLK